MDERQEKIRRRAHELWVAAGHPEGASDCFWLEAERELFGEGAPEGSEAGKQADLDRELDDTFPASDPPSGVQP